MGYYENPIDAAIVYDNAAIELHGEFAVTNKKLGLLDNQQVQLSGALDLSPCMSLVSGLLSEEPKRDHIIRPAFTGDVVASFILPLGVCKPQNAKRGAPGWAAMADRKKVARLMFAQHQPVDSPLPGRPQVLCLRLSSNEPDKYSDWAKTAIDVLCRPNKRCKDRLNLIYDDAPKYADVHAWWEPAKKGQGFCYIEVRTGKQERTMNSKEQNKIELEATSAADKLLSARNALLLSQLWKDYASAVCEFHAITGDVVHDSTIESDIVSGEVTLPETTNETEPPGKFDDYDNDSIDAITRSALNQITTEDAALTVGKLAKLTELGTKQLAKSLKRIGARSVGEKRGTKYYIAKVKTDDE